MTQRTLAPGAEVVLTEAEIRIAEFVGRERNAMAGTRGARNRIAHMTEADEVRAHTDGFGAELAFCRLCNVYPELTFATIRGADCHIGSLAVDVKAGRFDSANLLFWERNPAIDWYALMIVTWPRFRFAGAIRAADVTPQHKTDVGHGSTYLVPQRQLGGLTLTDEQVEEFCKHAVKASEIRWS